MAKKQFVVQDGLKIKGDTLLNGAVITDTPLAKLHIKTSANGSGANLNNVNGLLIENSGTGSANYAIKLATGSGNIFNVSNAGNLGLGTQDAKSILHVVGPASRPTALGEFDTAASAQFQSDSSNTDSLYIAEAASGAILQVTDGTTNSSTAKPMLLNPYGGDVGIGTESPGSKLDIRVADTENRKGLYIDQADTGEWGAMITSVDYGLLVRSTDTGTMPVLKVQGNNGATETLYASANGKVGIGTITPNERLTVSGNISATGTVYMDTLQFTGSSIKDSSGEDVMTFSNDGNFSVDGCMGVGTQTPNERLTVSGNISATGSITGGVLSNTIVCADTCVESPTVCGTTSVNTPIVNASSCVVIPDSGRIKLGTCNDLQIWHDGNNSLIKNNTGDLFIRSAGTYLQDPGGNETHAHFADNGAVKLYYDNAPTLATASTGVDITGCLTATCKIYSSASGWSLCTAGCVYAAGYIRAGQWACSDGHLRAGTYVSGYTCVVAGTCMCADSLVCGAQCVKSPIVCATSCVESSQVCGTTCVHSPWVRVNSGGTSHISVTPNYLYSLICGGTADFLGGDTRVWLRVMNSGASAVCGSPKIVTNDVGDVWIANHASDNTCLRLGVTTGGVTCATHCFKTPIVCATSCIQSGTADLMIGNSVINLASGFANQKGFSVDASSGRTDAVGNQTEALQLGRYGNDGPIQVWRCASTAQGSFCTGGILHACGCICTPIVCGTSCGEFAKVGIGINAPLEKLTLNGGTGDGATYDVAQRFQRTSSTGNVLASKIVFDDQDTNWGDLKFKMKTTASAGESGSYWTDALRIDGRYGDATFTSTTNRHNYHYINTTTAGYNPILGFAEAGTRQAYINYEGTANRMNIATEYDNAPIALMPNGTGNVGINTLTPNERLTVSGNISASGTVYADAFTSMTGGSGITFADDISMSGQDLTAQIVCGTTRVESPTIYGTTLACAPTVCASTLLQAANACICGAGVLEPKIQSSNNRVGLQLQGGQAGDVNWILYSGYPAAGDFNIRESGVANHVVVKKTTGNVQIASGSTILYGDGDALFSGAAANMSWDKSDSALEFQDNAKLKLGTGNDLQLYHDGGNSYVSESGAGALVLQSNGTAIVLEKTDGENMILANTDGDVKLYYDGSEKLATNSGGVTVTGTAILGGASFVDNATAYFGTGNDLRIYHDGNHSYIKDAGTGNLVVNGSQIWLKNAANSANMIGAVEGSYVKLYHNGTERLATTSTGVDVTGCLTQDIGSSGGNVIHTLKNTNREWQVKLEGSSQDLIFRNVGGASNTLRLKVGGDAVFANALSAPGNITTTGTGQIISASSLIAGGTLYVDENIRHTGDTNNYINFTTDTQKFYTNNAIALTIDSSQKVGICNTNPNHALSVTGNLSATGDAFIDGDLTVCGEVTYTASTVTATTTAFQDNFLLESTDSGSTGAPDITLYRNSSTPANDDDLGNILFRGRNNNSQDVEYAQMLTDIVDVTDGSEDAKIRFLTMKAGTLTDTLAMDRGSVGIGTTTPSRLLTLENNTGTVVNQSQLRINNAGAGDAYVYMYAGADWSFGIDNSDADKFKFNTSNDVSDGTEVLTLQRDGNVGIGTTAPNKALEIGGADTDIRFTVADSQHDIQFDAGQKTRIVGAGGSAANYLFFETNGSEAMRIKSDGNVGIGSSAPAAHLHLYKGSGTTTVLTEVNSNSTLGYEIKKTGSTTQHWKIVDGQTVNGVLEFYDATDSATRMAIDGNGVITSCGVHRVCTCLQSPIVCATSCVQASCVCVTGALTATGLTTLSGGARLMLGQALLGQTSGGTSTQLIYWGGTDIYYGRNTTSPNNATVASHIFRAAGNTRLTVDNSNITLTAGLVGTTATFSGVIKAPVGSAAAPSYTFTGDGDGGMWRPSANMIAFSTGGVERIRINNHGKVGIGTTAPDQLLHVNTSATAGGTNNFALRLQNPNTVADARVGIAFATNAQTGTDWDGAAIQGANNGVDGKAHILFGEVGNNTFTENVRFTTDGNVGIGVTDPDQALEVVGKIKSSGNWISGSYEFANGVLYGGDLKLRGGSGSYGRFGTHEGALKLTANTQDSTTYNVEITPSGSGITCVTTGAFCAVTCVKSATLCATSLLYTPKINPYLSNDTFLYGASCWFTLANENGYTSINWFSKYCPAGSGCWVNTHSSLKASRIGASQDVRFYTSQTTGSGSTITWDERVRFANDGKVGIGTTAPSTLLTLQQISNTSTGGLRIQDSANSSAFRLWKQPSGGASVLVDHGIDTLFLKQGKVGIGTSAPSALLEINGATPALRINDSDANAPFEARVEGASFIINDVNNDRDLFTATTGHLITIGNGSGGNIVLNTSANTLIPSGNVGIGTTAPGANLHIYEATTDTPLQITRAANTGNGMIKFETGTTDDWIVGLRNDSTSNFRIYSYGTSNDVFSINRADGNVGIGTAAPTGGKLEVDGSSTTVPLLIKAGTGANSIKFVGRSGDHISSLDFYQNNGSSGGAFFQSNGTWMRARADGGVHFRKDNTPTVTDTDGFTIEGMNLGVGTSAPDSLLEIENSTVAGNTQLHVHNNKTGDAAVLLLEGKRTSYNDTGQVLFANNGTNVALIKGYSGGTDGALGFFTKQSGGSLDEKLSISDAGVITSCGVHRVCTCLQSPQLCATSCVRVGAGSGVPALCFFGASSQTASIRHNSSCSRVSIHDDGSNERLTVMTQAGPAQGYIGVGTSLPSNLVTICHAAAQDTGTIALKVKNTTGDTGIAIEGTNDNPNGAYGSNRSGGTLVLENTNTTQNNYSMIQFRNACSYGVAGIHAVNYVHGTTGSAEAGLEFWVRNAGSNYHKALTINEDGKLDLGAAKLSIAGGTGSSGNVLTNADGAGTVCWSAAGSGTIGGSGTDNYIPRFNGTNAIENSLLYNHAYGVVINATSLTSYATNRQVFEVKGTAGTGAFDGGITNLSSSSDTNGHIMGRLAFINADNANHVNPTAVAGSTIAEIKATVVTSDSNAGDDSGGDLRFVVKPEAGVPAEKMTLCSNGHLHVGTFLIAPGSSDVLYAQQSVLGLRSNSSVQLMPGGTSVLCALANCVCVMKSMLVKPASGNTYLILESDNTCADVQLKLDSANSTRNAHVTFYNAGTQVGGIGYVASDTRMKMWGSNNPADDHLVVQSTGNVGIGTNNSAYTLEVKKAVNADWVSRIYNTSTNAASYGLLVRSDNSAAAATNFGVHNGTTHTFAVKGDGNVGIGTSAPGSKLDVVGAVKSRYAAGATTKRMDMSAENATNVFQYVTNPLVFYNNSTVTMALAQDRSVCICGNVAMKGTAGGSQRALDFSATNLDGGTTSNYWIYAASNQYWRQDGSARFASTLIAPDVHATTWICTPIVCATSCVRVGTSGANISYNSGLNRLEVDKDLKLERSVGSSIYMRATSGTTTGLLGKLEFGNNNIDSNVAVIAAYQAGATDAGELRFETEVSGGSLATRMTIASDGNVGIGITNPGTELSVVGTVSAADSIFGAIMEHGLADPDIIEHEEGTVLVWEDGGLKPCEIEYDSRVMGISKKAQESPIVIGAEPVLVTGIITEGDFIVTSEKTGHGKKGVSNNMFGKVIAQALEDGEGDSYSIRAMIRKF